MLIMSSNNRQRRPTGLKERYAVWLRRPNGRTGAPNYISLIILCGIAAAASLSIGWPALSAIMRGASMDGVVEENTRRGTQLVPIYPALLSSIGGLAICALTLLSVLFALTASGRNNE